MVRGIFRNFSMGDFGKALFVTFLAFNILTLLLSQFFQPFKELVSKFALGWLILVLGIVLFLVLRLVSNLKSMDKTSIFIFLITLAILLFLIIRFDLDFGRLFDMSIVRSELASIITP